MRKPGEGNTLWCRGRNERREEEAHARRQNSFNWHYLLNTDWRPEKYPPVAGKQLCRGVKNCSKSLWNLQWKWEVTMFLPAVVTSKGKLTTGIKTAYKLIPLTPKLINHSLKSPPFLGNVCSFRCFDAAIPLMLLSLHTFVLTEKCTEGEARFKERPVRQNSLAVAHPEPVFTPTDFPKLLFQTSIPGEVPLHA